MAERTTRLIPVIVTFAPEYVAQEGATAEAALSQVAHRDLVESVDAVACALGGSSDDRDIEAAQITVYVPEGTVDEFFAQMQALEAEGVDSAFIPDSVEDEPADLRTVAVAALIALFTHAHPDASADEIQGEAHNAIDHALSNLQGRD